MLRKTYAVLNAVRATLIVAVFAWIIGLCFVQIVLRYFTPASLTPFAWGDEMIRLSSIWVIFLAASLGVRESSHLSVEYFINKLFSARRVAVVKRLAMLVVLAVLAALVWYGWQQTRLNFPSLLENLAMSRAWFYAAIPVGCLYLFIDYCLILVYGEHPFSSKARAAAGRAAPAAGGEG